MRYIMPNSTAHHVLRYMNKSAVGTKHSTAEIQAYVSPWAFGSLGREGAVQKLMELGYGEKITRGWYAVTQLGRDECKQLDRYLN